MIRVKEEESRVSATVLLTLGRLPVALELARAFAGAGWRVVVAEPWGMHLLRMSRSVARCYRTVAPFPRTDDYYAQLLDIVAREGVELLLPVSEESVVVSGLRDRLPAGVELFAADQAQMLSLHDKYAFNARARSLGLSAPPSALADTPEAQNLSAATDTVLKPRLSCSGRGIRFHQRGATLPAAPGALLQQRVTGPLLSSFSVARGGRLFGTVVYRAEVTFGSVAVCFARVDDTAAITAWTERLVAGTGHTGLLGFDFIVDASGAPQAIECNPRATSGIHFTESASLVAAIRGDGPLRLRPERLLTEAYSCYMAGLADLLHGRGRRALSCLRAARDVTWRRDDPWPFLLMMINSWPLIRRAMMARRPFAEVTALDIEWRGTEGD